jgi:hypothetical protein
VWYNIIRRGERDSDPAPQGKRKKEMLNVIYIILATIGIALGFIMCFTMVIFLIYEYCGTKHRTPEFVDNYMENIDKIFTMLH